MSSDSYNAAQFSWSDFELRLDQLARCVEQRLTQHEFFTRLTSILADDWARRIDVWEVAHSGSARVIHSVNPHSVAGRNALPTVGKLDETLTRSKLLAKDQAFSVLTPIRPVEELQFVLEFDFDTTNNLESHLDFFDAIGGLVEDFHRRLLLRDKDESANDELLAFSLRTQRSLELRDTAYTVANDGRKLVGCQRLSVVVHLHGKLKEVAVSGVDEVDRRSEQLQSLFELAKLVERTEEPLWYHGDSSDLPPQIESTLATYVDASHVKRLAAVPISLSRDDRPGGCAVLLAEDFEPVSDDSVFRASVQQVSSTSCEALRNAVQHDSLPFRKFLQRLSALRRWTNTKSMIAVGLLIVFIIGVMPGRFDIRAQGSLNPAVRRHLFAPEDAVVDATDLPADGTVVEDGVLVTLRNDELEQKLLEVDGEIKTQDQLLKSIRAKAFAQGTRGAEQATGELAAEEEAIKEKLVGLRAKYNELQVRKDRLRLSSPFDGVVLSWDPADMLKDRPVTAGDKLLSIAKPSGAWSLELKINEKDIRHVTTAMHEQDAPLQVEFVLATDPSTSWTGELLRLGERSEIDPGESPTVRADVLVKDVPLDVLHAGVSVRARVICGRRPYAYLWSRELWDLVQLYLLF